MCHSWSRPQCVDFNFCLKDKHSTELSKQSSLKISFKKVLVSSDRSSFCFISVRDKNVLQDQRDSLLILFEIWLACYLRHNALHWWCGIAFVSEAVALNPLHFADASYLLGRILNQCSLPEQAPHCVGSTLPHCGAHTATLWGFHTATLWGAHTATLWGPTARFVIRASFPRVLLVYNPQPGLPQFQL